MPKKKNSSSLISELKRKTRRNYSSEGFKLSNVGFDYFRRFHPKWEWGIQLDLDFESGFQDFEGVQLAGIVAYSISKKWPVAFLSSLLLLKIIGFEGHPDYPSFQN